jgi:hypothetical protein
VVVNKITQLKKTAASKAGGGGYQVVIENIEGLINRLNQLKTKVSRIWDDWLNLKYNNLLEAEDYLIEVMRKRLSHL